MHASVRDGVVEVREDMVLVGEPAEGTDSSEYVEVARAGTFEEHCDAAVFEFGDDLTKCLGSGCVENLELGQAEDDDAYIADRGEFGEEALCCAEEQRTVETVGDDVLVE